MSPLRPTEPEFFEPLDLSFDDMCYTQAPYYWRSAIDSLDDDPNYNHSRVIDNLPKSAKRRRKLAFRGR